ncbi:MAG: hypothetical protein QOH48_822 [Actinomycetota bacterium]|jgi:hypothetical protein|nr:hypothetical protein [Actinomycetota bacterium]
MVYAKPGSREGSALEALARLSSGSTTPSRADSDRRRATTRKPVEVWHDAVGEVEVTGMAGLGHRQVGHSRG